MTEKQDSEKRPTLYERWEQEGADIFTITPPKKQDSEDEKGDN